MEVTNMGIVSLLLILGAGFTGLAGIIKAICNNKTDSSPKVGPGFFDSFKEIFRKS